MFDENPRVPVRLVINDVALDTDPNAAASGVTFCFTERTGGCSRPPYESLNLGLSTGDDPAAVLRNRSSVLEALDAGDLAGSLFVPRQVHGLDVAVLDGSNVGVTADEMFPDGCDAVVCTRRDQAVMLLFADCVPVVLLAPGGFAVAHSGWRGTLGGIAGITAERLAQACSCETAAVRAYIGPHIGASAYEVSEELLGRFVGRFGPCARHGVRNLDLTACVTAALAESGVDPGNVVDCGLCTASLTGRFFSYRAEGGVTGRHAAVAFMR